MSNGLLNGLTEAWNPDVTLAMIGQKTGLNTNADSGLTYVAQAGFPTGHALQVTGATGVNIITPSSALIQAIGLTDFWFVYWLFGSSPNSSNFNVSVVLGENNTNGFDCGNSFQGQGLPQDWFFEIPGADNSFPFTNTTGMPVTANTAHMVSVGYTTADAKLHLHIDAGGDFPVVNMVGVGPSDPTNALQFSINSVVGANSQLGPAYLWQGTAGVANAIAQLSNLYTNKLRYADFDNGGGGGVTASGNSLTSWV